MSAKELAKTDTWEEIKTDYFRAMFMDITPGAGFRNPKTSEIINEKKSAAWNIKEVKRLQDAYNNELLRLINARTEAFCDVKDRAVAFIACNSGLTEKGARLLWDHVCEEYQASGDMFSKISEYIFLPISSSKE